MSITPKNWGEFQHYKDRRPTWIKLHKVLLDDYQFACLPVASRALAPCIWLLASEYEEGEITASIEEIAFRCHLTRNELIEALIPLIDKGFLIASEPLAMRYQDAIPEKEKEKEKEKETQIEIEGATQKRAPKRAMQVPELWEPSIEAITKLEAKGHSKWAIAHELERFRDYHRSKGTVFKDFEAAFRTWMSNAKEFAAKMGKTTNGSGKPHTVRSNVPRWEDVQADYRSKYKNDALKRYLEDVEKAKST